MIVVITGAIKNVGDYLIGARARKLLRAFVDEDIVDLNRFDGLSQHITTLNNARAIFLCGGPAYSKSMVPNVYDFGVDLKEIKVPIIPFGLGWSGKPFGKPDSFVFNEKTTTFLNKIHRQIGSSSCRDVITESILNRQGFTNVTMTGCPVWYDLESIGKPLAREPIKKIVFTTPAKPRLLLQNHHLMRILRQEFPEAELICSFHRGIKPDRYTSWKKGVAYQLMAADAKRLGYIIKDVAYGNEKIDFYRNADLHVGYRVHAHLDFLSRRHPTVLINEDGRGQGMAQSLKLPILNFNDPKLIEDYKNALKSIHVGEVNDLENAVSFIDDHFLVMKDYLNNIASKI